MPQEFGSAKRPKLWFAGGYDLGFQYNCFCSQSSSTELHVIATVLETDQANYWNGSHAMEW